MLSREQVAAGFLEENFRNQDRIAIVLLKRPSGAVLQRIASAETVASAKFQAWLRHMNAQRHEVYVSMNTLKCGAHRRTKNEIECIRHLYLDFDENGTRAVEALLTKKDLPEPNYLVESSPDKWQVLWRVESFTPEQAEEVERGLARETGADVAVIDVARVLRLPGFYNHKYAHPHLVTLEKRSEKISSPEQFPKFAAGTRDLGLARTESRSKMPPGWITQSERDWAYVRNELRHGRPPETLIEELKVRRADKAQPTDYARRTVSKAIASLEGDAQTSEIER